MKEISNSISKDNFSQSSYSIKKNLQSAVKSKSLNDVNKSPVASEADVPADKHKNKQRMLEHNSDRGNLNHIFIVLLCSVLTNVQMFKHLLNLYDVMFISGILFSGDMKVKCRRDSDQDSSRPSKKSKSDKVHSINEEWIIEESGTTRKVGSNSTFPTTSVGKDRPRQKNHSSSQDFKSGKDGLPDSAETTKDKGQGFGLVIWE